MYLAALHSSDTEAPQETELLHSVCRPCADDRRPLSRSRCSCVYGTDEEERRRPPFAGASLPRHWKVWFRAPSLVELAKESKLGRRRVAAADGGLGNSNTGGRRKQPTAWRRISSRALLTALRELTQALLRITSLHKHVGVQSSSGSTRGSAQCPSSIACTCSLASGNAPCRCGLLFDVFGHHLAECVVAVGIGGRQLEVRRAPSALAAQLAVHRWGHTCAMIGLPSGQPASPNEVFWEGQRKRHTRSALVGNPCRARRLGVRGGRLLVS